MPIGPLNTAADAVALLGQASGAAVRRDPERLLLQGWLWLILCGVLLVLGLTAILCLSLLWRRGLRRQRLLDEAQAQRREAALAEDPEEADIWRTAARRVPLDERPDRDRDRRPPREPAPVDDVYTEDDEDDEGPPEDPFNLFATGDPLGRDSADLDPDDEEDGYGSMAYEDAQEAEDGDDDPADEVDGGSGGGFAFEDETEAEDDEGRDDRRSEGFFDDEADDGAPPPGWDR